MNSRSPSSSELGSHDVLIGLAGIGKAYGSTSALDGLDLQIDRGEYVAIVGPSGSGKSTLLGLVGLLETSSAGSYRLLGESVPGIGDKEASSLRNRRFGFVFHRFGFVFQQFHLLPQLTAWENVARPLVYASVPAAERKARSLQLLAALGLAQRSRHRALQLSGGEQQRVAIARALINDPDVILADEPTGNLPQEQWRQVLDLFETEWAKGKTVIIVTHEPAVAARAKRTVQLRDGRLDQEVRE